MVPIARRNLLADKVKLAVAFGGVTLAIVLILVVNSLYQGVQRQIDSFIRELPGNMWITQQGTTDLVFSNSNLPNSAGNAIRSVAGVHGVYTLSGRLMAFEVNGKEVRTYVMALDSVQGSDASLPEAFAPRRGTIILDHTFARQAGLSVGDTLRFNDHSLSVVEIRSIANVLVTQFSFVSPQDFRDLFGVPDTVNYFLVSLKEGVSPEAVREPLHMLIKGSSVFTTEEFAGRASEKGTGDFLPIIRVILAISFIVGLAVLSLIIYSATIERAREYAIMKVIGASPLELYRIVLSQSTLIAVVGFVAGVGLAFAFNRVAGDLVPQFITYIRWRDVALVFGVTIVLSTIASYVPINRVARIDPASVFRA